MSHVKLRLRSCRVMEFCFLFFCVCVYVCPTIFMSRVRVAIFTISCALLKLLVSPSNSVLEVADADVHKYYYPQIFLLHPLVKINVRGVKKA